MSIAEATQSLNEPKTPEKCSYGPCGKEETPSKKLLKCSACQKMYTQLYCSKECAKADWKEHKWSCEILGDKPASMELKQELTDKLNDFCTAYKGAIHLTALKGLHALDDPEQGSQVGLLLYLRRTGNPDPLKGYDVFNAQVLDLEDIGRQLPPTYLIDQQKKAKQAGAIGVVNIFVSAWPHIQVLLPLFISKSLVDYYRARGVESQEGITNLDCVSELDEIFKSGDPDSHWSSEIIKLGTNKIDDARFFIKGKEVNRNRK